jgi:hypothetical protein
VDSPLELGLGDIKLEKKKEEEEEEKRKWARGLKQWTRCYCDGGEQIVSIDKRLPSLNF